MRRRITSAKREEIEKEQETLSKSIVRPFDVFSGLPVSYSEPPYGNYESVLKQPLTVKDSGILYRSLMKSRLNYINSCPMFKLYWLKQTAYAKKLMGDNKQYKSDERVPVLAPDVNARDVMVKLCDAGMTFGPHSFEVRIYIAKDERSKKKEEVEVKLEEPDKTDATEETIDVKQLEKELTPEKAVTDGASTPATGTSPATDSATKAPVTNSVTQATASPTSPSSSIAPPAAPSPAAPVPAAPIAVPAASSTPSAPSPAAPIPSPSMRNSPPRKDIKKSAKKDPADAITAENSLMVSNLHAIAKVDVPLRRLLKLVSSGTATDRQLTLFQGYILRAREMGPPPHPFLVPNFRLDPHIPLKVRKSSKEKGKKYLSFPQYNQRDQGLTAFQEKYMWNATLTLEFVENSNIRYMLPKQAICEVLPSQRSSDDRNLLISFLWIHNQNEMDYYEAELENYNNAVKERELKQREEEAKQKAEEERQKQIAEGKIPADPEPEPEPIPSGINKRRPPSRRGKKNAKPKTPKVQKELVPPEEPEYRYTAVTFELHDIPLKFIPLFLNSMKPESEVREFMKKILEKGTRSSSLHLWYQVDGKMDEKLAEGVRVELNNEERKMTGISSNANVAKKRKL